MQSLTPHPSAKRNPPLDLASEVARLAALLDERRGELVALQEEFREFKMRYAHVVGSRLAELAEVERAIKKAEDRLLCGGVADDGDAEADAGAETTEASPVAQVKTSMRKLFWSVARLFHPDHATDEGEARRRHTIMAEASRAYREGDVESLHLLLGDEELQSYCATAQETGGDAPPELAGRLVRLKEELLTVEFGLKRIRQESLHRLMLSVSEDAAHGRDGLTGMAARIARQITKARHRLEHLA